MAADGDASLLVDDGPTPGTARAGIGEVASILDTAELRWFVTGPLPPEVRVWFTGTTGVSEDRCDTYLLDGRGDVGVKRRFRETLELKVRSSLDGWIDLGDGFGGTLEVWRKWSPADDVVEDDPGGRWDDVCKSIVKRRFSLDGTEIAFSSDPPIAAAGCDVEVADVTFGAVRAWTFAFAAFGPPPTRRDALLASWRELRRTGECPEPFGPRAGRAMGYPEWLALEVAPDGPEPSTPPRTTPSR